MRCTICGGELLYKDGIYCCESCGIKQGLSSFYENTEVFIGYIENDEQGRRTKDSLIAQDLYSKLQSTKVNTFYQRISVGDLAGEEFEKGIMEAFGNAKIIILVGTTVRHFKMLVEKYGEHFYGRTVIPVYSQINPYDLPEQIVDLQALNYDTIGAAAGLPNTILNMLGRAAEIDVIEVVGEKSKKRRKNGMIIAAVVGAIILMASIYFVFFTPYVLDSKKYDYAIELSEKGQYVEAIHLFAELGDYKNSEELLNSVYNKYEGYFINEDETVSLHLIINESKVAEIEVSSKTEEGIVRMSTSSSMSEANVKFDYKDDQNNQGTGSIQLKDDGIALKVSTDSSGRLSLGDIEYFFKFSSRSDSSLQNEITQEDLLSWIRDRATESQLKSKGYELEYVQPVYKSTSESIYNIKNTLVNVGLYSYDFKKGDLYDQPALDDPMTVFVSAPASIIAPDLVGETINPFVKNDVLYGIDGDFSLEGGRAMDYSNLIENRKVNKDTIIIATSKNSFSEESWIEMLEMYAPQSSPRYASQQALEACFDYYGVDFDGYYYREEMQYGGELYYVYSQSPEDLIYLVQTKQPFKIYEGRRESEVWLIWSDGVPASDDYFEEW